MPKEQITFSKVEKIHRDCEPGDACSPSCTVVAESYPALYVRWGADGHDRTGNVQVSLLKYEQPTWDEWIASDPYEQTETAYPTPPIAGEFFSQVLSRSEINELIKVLRRARDQAYGRDE